MVCKNCKKRYRKTYDRQIFCSVKCRNQFHNKQQASKNSAINFYLEKYVDKIEQLKAVFIPDTNFI